ncbi:hypothetical protein PG997_011636 [Apiospora hydei]|uniref:Xylanolytic transcriptional activator regulatory domain-containing protein n=1 Tax=Apiospora hydei TaxID=1337664 RepID=A0ABR1VNK8_9PEZI
MLAGATATAATIFRPSRTGGDGDGGSATALSSQAGLREETNVIVIPALYFLDPENSVPRLPSSSTVSLQRASSSSLLLDELWDSVGGEVPDVSEDIVDRYFATVHRWLPILSNKQLYRTLTQQQNQRTDPRFALLLVCMRLITTRPPATPDQQQPAAATCPLYLSAKESLVKVETRCLPSLALLQATILMAAYELAHGIYPAAYLSAGHAARMGIMMGFHDREHCPQMFHSPVTWTGREEERRAWWAVVILDRYPLNPIRGNCSPAPDAAWDLGAIGVNEALFVMSSSPSTSEASSSSSTTSNTGGSFANLCQSAHLLGLVLRHREDLAKRRPLQQPIVANSSATTSSSSGEKESGEFSFHIREARQLHHAIAAFTRHLCGSSCRQGVSGDPGVLGAGVAGVAGQGGGEVGQGPASAAMAVAFSARIILYDLYACNERWEGCTRSAEETELQQLALGGIYDAAREVAGIARRQLQLILTVAAVQRPDEEEASEADEEGAEDDVECSTSPLICHCLYQVAGECEWLVLEDENSEAAAWIQDVVELLAIMAQRWQVASAYLADVTSWPGYKQVLNTRLEGMNIAM